PLNTVLLDILLVVNITIALTILITTLYINEPLEMSIFPPLLLLTTIFRLALNISSTRLILGNGGDAGTVIETFGHFVIGDNIVVGVVIFLIIIVIQFLVITRGSERVSEVAARFTLDAMPGKQMSIDADLNTGIIDEREAKERREKIQKEADFYGSMDGASKFVKGDATVSIIITCINIIGGIVIGMLSGTGMTGSEIVRVYTLATVGDGLVSQLPALLISTATGIVVTRSASDNDMGKDISKAFTTHPFVLMITGGMLVFLSLIPGLPKIPIIVTGIFLIGLGYTVNRRMRFNFDMELQRDQEMKAQEIRKPENIVTLLNVDPIEMEFGYSIIPLADVNKGGDLLDRVVMIRRQCAMELGVIIPPIRLRDNIQLEPSEYVVKVKSIEVARGSVMVDRYLAMNSSNSDKEVVGIETVDPAFGLPALWVDNTEREKAEMYGYTIVDPPSVIATHLTEVVKRYSYELLGRQDVQLLLDNLREKQPALVDDVVPSAVTVGDLQKILSNLLREGISIRDLGTILETLGDYGDKIHDTEILTEYVRQGLRRAITQKYAPERSVRVITVAPHLEQTIMDSIQRSDQGSYLSLEPQMIHNIFKSLREALEKVMSFGIQPVVLTAPQIRVHFKHLTEQMAPDLVVLSYGELEQNIEIQSDGVVSI
ncbi:MAG: flagellar biosynthesis protein FlhA, partial [Oscillospiraceae bacterium]|nr:flagellar biosynthesis protein FlhA [Oscillospiraceae bacterium]